VENTKMILMNLLKSILKMKK